MCPPRPHMSSQAHGPNPMQQCATQLALADGRVESRLGPDTHKLAFMPTFPTSNSLHMTTSS